MYGDVLLRNITLREIFSHQPVLKDEDMSAWLSDNMIELLVHFLTPGLEGDPGVKFLQPGVLSTVIPSFAAWRGSVTSAGGRIVDMNDWLTWSLRDSSWRLKILPLDSARSILALCSLADRNIALLIDIVLALLSSSHMPNSTDRSFFLAI